MPDQYRYTLRRQAAIQGGRLLWVMLNPSTADEFADDPTIRRCIRFTRDLGFSQMRVVNLYALRATNPKDLWSADDPVGPENDTTIATEALLADMVICAWGGNARADRVQHVLDVLSHNGVRHLHALKINADGSPSHPLYLHADSQPVPFP